MTTRIHIVNFGPDPIEADTGALYNLPPKIIYPQSAENFYVFDGQDVVVREKKQEQQK